MDLKKIFKTGAIVILIVAVFVGFIYVQASKTSQANEDADSIQHLKDSVATLSKQKADLCTSLTNCQGQNEADNSSSNDSIATLNNNIKTLNGVIDSLKLENAQVYKDLSNCQASKKVVRPAKRVVRKPVIRRVVVVRQFVRPQQYSAPQYSAPVAVTRNEQPPVTEDNLSELRDGNEEILACFRTNGSKDQHFPHYAIDRGASVGNAKGNNMRGYNYVLTPVESISGNVGVTKDGTFFISASYLKKYLNMSGESLKYVDLLYKGNWGGARMSLQNGYYVLRAN